MALSFYPVYVNYIAKTVTATDLRSLFVRFGAVIDVVIVDDYGFVNMATLEGAELAIQEVNGRGLHSSLLHVDYSEDMKRALQDEKKRFRCAPDPYTGVVGGKHPDYPQNLESPWIDSTDAFRELLGNKAYLDERLRIINSELNKLKDSPLEKEDGASQRSYSKRSNSRDNRSRSQRKRSRSQGRRSRSQRRSSRSPGRRSGSRDRSRIKREEEKPKMKREEEKYSSSRDRNPVKVERNRGSRDYDQHGSGDQRSDDHKSRVYDQRSKDYDQRSGDNRSGDHRSGDHRSDDHRSKGYEQRSGDIKIRGYDQRSADYKSRDYDKKSRDYEQRTKDQDQRSRGQDQRKDERFKDYDRRSRDEGSRSYDHSSRQDHERSKERSSDHRNTSKDQLDRSRDHHSLDRDRDNRKSQDGDLRSKLKELNKGSRNTSVEREKEGHPSIKTEGSKRRSLSRGGREGYNQAEVRGQKRSRSRSFSGERRKSMDKQFRIQNDQKTKSYANEESRVYREIALNSVDIPEQRGVSKPSGGGSEVSTKNLDEDSKKQGFSRDPIFGFKMRDDKRSRSRERTNRSPSDSRPLNRSLSDNRPYNRSNRDVQPLEASKILSKESEVPPARDRSNLSRDRTNLSYERSYLSRGMSQVSATPSPPRFGHEDYKDENQDKRPVHLRLGFRGDDDVRDSSKDRKESRSPSIIIASEDDLDLSEEDDYQDMLKKSTKIKINIASKSMDDMTRKIRIEQELENQPEYLVRIEGLVLEAVPSLPGLEIKILEVKEENKGTTIRLKSSSLKHVQRVFMFLRRTAPIHVMMNLRDNNGFYLASNGQPADLYLDRLSLVDAKSICQPDSEPMLLCRKHGVVEDTAIIEKKCRVVHFSSILRSDLESLMSKLSYLESGFSCVPFLLPVTELGIDVYRTLLLKDPAVMLPHILRIEGGLGYGFKGKHRQTVKNRIFNSVNSRGRVKINTQLGLHPEGDEDFLNVLLVCTRAEALATCLELTNTPVYGNIMYVSAKDSMVTEFKEEVSEKLKAKFGELEDMHDDMVVNRSEPEAEDSTKTVREICLFVDGVKENMDYTYFENLFNKYGLVSKVAHRDGQRFSFVSLLSNEERVLKALEEVTGTVVEDSTLVVQLKFSENESFVSKGKDIVKKKLALIRQLERDAAAKELKESQADGNTKFFYYISHIDNPMTKEELATLFEPYGKVVKSQPHANKTFGFVELLTTEERAIEVIIKLSGIEFCGNRLKIAFRNMKAMEAVTAKARQVARDRLKETTEQMKNLSRGGPPSDYLYPEHQYPEHQEQEDEYWHPEYVSEYNIFSRRDEDDNQDSVSYPAPGNDPPAALSARMSVPPPTAVKVEIPDALKSLMMVPGGAIEQPEENRMEYIEDDDVRISGGYKTASGPPGYSTAPGPTSYTTTAPINQSTNSSSTTDVAFSKPLVEPVKVIPDIKWNNIAEAVSLMQKLPGLGPKGEGPKAVRRFHISRMSVITREYDVKELFSKYGQINRVDIIKQNSGFIQAFMSELNAVKCVCELNGFKFKGSSLHVDFAKGSYEETREFKSKWAEEIKFYLSEEHKKTLTDLGVPKKPIANFDDIGSGLKNFDASLSLDAIHPSFKQKGPTERYYEEYRSDPYNYAQSSYEGVGPAGHGTLTPGGDTGHYSGGSSQPGALLPAADTQVGAATKQQDENYLFDVKGTIHSIQNKQILVEFSLYGATEKTLAKLIPGQMYLNGRQNLGFVIKSNTYHMWPKNVKDFLQIGTEVVMDLKRLSSKEMHELKDKDRLVHWTVPFLKLPGMTVKDDDLVISESNQPSLITTGIIKKLYPKWGLLEAKDQMIIFKHTSVFWRTAPLTPELNLSSVDIEVGDLIAVHVEELKDKASYLSDLPIAEVDYEASARLVQLKAKLIWQVTAEVDPWVYCQPESPDKIKYLASSSTLNRTLPSEREAEHSNVSGIVDSIHLPAGVVVTINPDALSKIRATEMGSSGAASGQYNKVYTHRSRIHINGAKILTDKTLDLELKPGDEVSVDIMRNRSYPDDPPFAMFPSHWVALALRSNTVVRGVQIASKLKKENKSSGDDGEGVEKAQVVYLCPPGEESGPAITGTAVIHTGEYLGQRVEFDRSVCWAYTFSLAKSDLGYFMKKDEFVYVKLKAYNSYCVDKLWIGFASAGRKEGSMDQAQIKFMKEDLEKKGLTQSEFDVIIKGQYVPRKFVPLERQSLQGTVMSLHTEGDVATSLTIKLPSGDLVKADREAVYIFGHWMGLADLSYCMDGERVFLEVPPRFSQEDETASLVWIGERPEYRGMTSHPYQTMDIGRRLTAWLSRMGIDMYAFKSLCEGTLPPKRSVNPMLKSSGSLPAGIDHDTLKQASLLQKMKSQLGSDKVMDLLKSLIDTGEDGPGKEAASTSSKPISSHEASGSSWMTSAPPPPITSSGQPFNMMSMSLPPPGLSQAGPPPPPPRGSPAASALPPGVVARASPALVTPPNQQNAQSSYQQFGTSIMNSSNQAFSSINSTPQSKLATSSFNTQQPFQFASLGQPPQPASTAPMSTAKYASYQGAPSVYNNQSSLCKPPPPPAVPAPSTTAIIQQQQQSSTQPAYITGGGQVKNYNSSSVSDTQQSGYSQQQSYSQQQGGYDNSYQQQQNYNDGQTSQQNFGRFSEGQSQGQSGLLGPAPSFGQQGYRQQQHQRPGFQGLGGQFNQGFGGQGNQGFSGQNQQSLGGQSLQSFGGQNPQSFGGQNQQSQGFIGPDQQGFIGPNRPGISGLNNQGFSGQNQQGFGGQNQQSFGGPNQQGYSGQNQQGFGGQNQQGFSGHYGQQGSNIWK